MWGPASMKSFSHALLDGTVQLHHKVLLELCEWADSVRSLPTPIEPPVQPPVPVQAPVPKTDEAAIDKPVKKSEPVHVPVPVGGIPDSIEGRTVDFAHRLGWAPIDTIALPMGGIVRPSKYLAKKDLLPNETPPLPPPNAEVLSVHD